MWRRVTNTTARCPENEKRVVDDGYTCERKNLALATVMLVAEDMLALHIFPMLDAGLLAYIHIPVRSCPGFCAIYTGLAPFEPRRLLIGQLTGLDALLNPVLLIDISLHIALHALGESRIGIAGNIVVLQPIDRAGLLILCMLNAGRFCRRQIAIVERFGFHPVNPGLSAFQSCCLASVELARL
jgi:hypothetical protein